MTTTTHTTPIDWCVAHKACAEGRKWVVQYHSFADAWDACPRADFMLWALAYLGLMPDYRTLRLFACWCARNTPLGGGRTTWGLLIGECTADELDAARSAQADYLRTLVPNPFRRNSDGVTET